MAAWITAAESLICKPRSHPTFPKPALCNHERHVGKEFFEGHRPVMDQRMMLQICRTAKRVCALEQCRTAHGKKRIPQQERRFKSRPASAAIANADVNSLRSEVHEPSAGINQQVIVGMLRLKSLDARQQPLVRECRRHGNAHRDPRRPALRRSKAMVKRSKPACRSGSAARA